MPLPVATIGLAIPTFNRFGLLMECIAEILEDARIGEIVISDDSSTDGSWEKLVEWARGRRKVVLSRNTANLDCYRNKREAVERAMSEWVILFDDDNIIRPDYIDTLFALAEWDRDTIYCPEYAEPFFNYHAFAGKIVTRANVAQLMKQKHFGTALNTCNYFLNREAYIEVWDGSIDPHTADSIFHAHNWLASGRRMMIVPKLRYFHRVHEGSHFKRERRKTGVLAKVLETKLKEME